MIAECFFLVSSAAMPRAVLIRTNPSEPQMLLICNDQSTTCTPFEGDSLISVVHDLARQWQADTMFTSDPEEIRQHPDYRAIVAMGDKVVPFMLKEVQEDPAAMWYSALAEITGIDPIPPEHHGDARKMADAWIAWGIENGRLAV